MTPVDWYRLGAWPLLARLDAEEAHVLVLRLLAQAQRIPGLLRLLECLVAVRDPGLAVEAFGVRFPNPVGLAAGLDKDARAPAAFAALGFGAVEIGTVTPVRQSGQPRPRIFRLPAEHALINRMGFPSAGAAQVRAQLLSTVPGRIGAPPTRVQRTVRALPGGAALGVNLGKAASTPLHAAARDYLVVLDTLHDLADYMAVNISSPNTPGLRSLQEGRALEALLGTLIARRDALAVAQGGQPVPVLVKIAPDLDRHQLAALVTAVLAGGVDGIIATNTTLSRDGITHARRAEAGGLSGAPLRRRATEVVRWIAQETDGKLPIIAAGGIMHPDHALEKLDAGAALVQLYTGLIYSGPALPAQICHALLARRRRS